MQLVELTANRPSFKTVRFNPTGLSLIVGEKTEGAGIKDTFNGVGKSLSIELINFCLGSNKKADLENVLPGWEFTLRFKIAGETFTVTRATKDQNDLMLNGDFISLNKFRTLLGEKIFYLNPPIPNVTFRSLLSFFMRTGKAGYASVRGDEKNPYARNLNLTYLLGLDYNRALKKHDLKIEIDKLVESKKLFEEHETLKTHYSSDVQINLADLDEKIARLAKAIKSFQVAENYHAIRKEADEAARYIRTLANEEFTLNHALGNIEKSLKTEPDLDLAQVEELYGQAQVEVDHLIKKKIEETLEFHNSLLKERIIRLTKERTKLQNKLHNIQLIWRETATREQELIKLLDSKGALEELTALNVQHNELIHARAKLTQYSDFLERFDQKKAELKTLLATENLATERYLNGDSAKAIRDQNLKLFQKLAKEFYSDKPSGISVQNNDGENQTRYDINIKIQQDQSDGIDEVKIFCFDWLVLLAQHNHKIQCLLHDSRLFSNMDPRQQATALRLASEYAASSNVQYIATFNANMLDDIKRTLEEYGLGERFEAIQKSIVLYLKDDKPSSKLLGIDVDLNYEK